jgi:pyridoxamine 5'-phosphate oxidase
LGTPRVRLTAEVEYSARAERPGALDVVPDDAYSTDPFAWFHASFARALALESFDPCRAALATVDADGTPHVRFVLVRQVDARGFAFFTNLNSPKARDLEHAKRAALAFHWASISEQVRIEGRVQRVSEAEADAYFATRPRASQLSAWASEQSRPIADRATLDARFADAEARFSSVQVVPRPAHWGGFRVAADRIEFWIGRDARLHDRWSFVRDADGFRCSRLQP